MGRNGQEKNVKWLNFNPLMVHACWSKRIKVWEKVLSSYNFLKPVLELKPYLISCFGIFMGLKTHVLYVQAHAILLIASGIHSICLRPLWPEGFHSSISRLRSFHHPTPPQFNAKDKQVILIQSHSYSLKQNCANLSQILPWSVS